MNEIQPSVVLLLALMKIRGVGRRAALRIVEKAQTRVEGFDFSPEALQESELPIDEIRANWKAAAEQIRRGIDEGIAAASFFDSSYPARLRHTPDPPAVLFIKGNSDGLHAHRSLAVVGTREPTAYGEAVALKSAEFAARAGFTIVSGLATGCDTKGHEGCLNGDGKGVAVMAHGLDHVYPAANRGLAQRLLETGGCLVGEYPVGMKPFRTAFAERDRIQSGLADAVLVIETDIKGGTMHTVNFSRAQKRPLACIAHPERLLGEEKTRGNQKLIKDGWAKPIVDGTALADFLSKVAPKKDESALTSPDKPPAKEPVQQAWAF